MKLKSSRRKQANLVPGSRWAAYATAGAATALAGASSAEADINYSGTLNVSVPFGESVVHSFALDNGAKLSFLNVRTSSSVLGVALFRLKSAAVSNQLLGIANGSFRYPSNLGAGVNLAAGPFVAFNGSFFATLAYAYGFGNDKFLAAGTGFIGFRFNGGAGIEYGWARVTMDGSPFNGFTLVDYAWADPGTGIVTGQTAVPEPGSLGLLAVGAAGLLFWRRNRAKVA